ncbi:MAG: peptide chain release factor 2 [Sphaerochaetaceae bacterium]|nr:peptide chain release factor 2 [Sphaerochaetaceae bacterium]
MFFQNKSQFESVKEEAYTVWRRLDPQGMEKKIAELEAKTLEPGFWDDPNNAQSLFTELNSLKDTYNTWKELIDKMDEMSELMEIYADEPDNAEEEAEINEQIETMLATYQKLRVKTLLDGKFDKNDCFLTIHAGAGGTEASDWANMLMRMYLRYCERSGFKSQILDLQEDEGGIKSATIKVSGPYTFGYLKGEAGVHRLVRISPFDSQKRRHTSFTSVYASPVIDDTIEIDLKPEDYRLDTYRAGGAGGQHVNKTDSAVRITHYATGIVVQCQNERSQVMNKDVAFKMLKSRLYEYYREEKEKEHQKDAIEKKEITWGSQIRSYVFQPYTMVKDHRTGTTIGNIQAVMDGEIEPLIESYLQWGQ